MESINEIENKKKIAWQSNAVEVKSKKIEDIIYLGQKHKKPTQKEKYTKLLIKEDKTIKFCPLCRSSFILEGDFGLECKKCNCIIEK